MPCNFIASCFFIDSPFERQDCEGSGEQRHQQPGGEVRGPIDQPPIADQPVLNQVGPEEDSLVRDSTAKPYLFLLLLLMPRVQLSTAYLLKGGLSVTGRGGRHKLVMAAVKTKA